MSEFKNELISLMPIVSDKNFSLDEKIEIIERAFEREYARKIKLLKKKAISMINSAHEFDKRDARIIVMSLYFNKT